MPKLRRLSGAEVIAILEQFGFVVTRVKGSHHRLKWTGEDRSCYTTVPVYGNQPLPTGTLRAIVRQVSACVSQDALHTHFYTD